MPNTPSKADAEALQDVITNGGTWADVCRAMNKAYGLNVAEKAFRNVSRDVYHVHKSRNPEAYNARLRAFVVAHNVAQGDERKATVKAWEDKAPLPPMFAKGTAK